MLTILTFLQYVTCPYDLRGWCWCYDWVRWLPTKTPLFDMMFQHLDAWQHLTCLTRCWVFVATEPEEPKHHLFLTLTEWILCLNQRWAAPKHNVVTTWNWYWTFFFPWTPTRKWRVSSSRLESDISSWEASSIRIVFAEYFSSPVDAVSWQHSVVWGTKQHHRNFCWISECLCMSFLPYVTLSVSPWHQTCHDK